MLKTTLLTLVLVCFALPVMAQDTSAPPADTAAVPIQCTVEDAQATNVYIDDILTQAKAALDAGDIESALGNYRALSLYASGLNALCYGLQFEGQDSQVIGPVIIPTGVYTVVTTLTSTGEYDHAYTTVERLTGECGSPYADTVPIAQPKPGVPDEQVFRATDCTALIEIAGAGSWTLTFTRVTQN